MALPNHNDRLTDFKFALKSDFRKSYNELLLLNNLSLSNRLLLLNELSFCLDTTASSAQVQKNEKIKA
jgi:hypothetical protein